ncbi:MAG: hypothetical protein ACKV2Q_13135 [Planctomycetaceae bacterium]
MANVAWDRQAQLEDHYGQALALQDLGQALAAGEDAATLAAFYLVPQFVVDLPSQREFSQFNFCESVRTAVGRAERND